MKKLLFYTVLTGLAESIYRVVFNLFLRDIGYTNSFISHITSLEMIGSAILGLFIGIAGDKFGKKIMLLISSLVFTTILLFRVFHPSENILLLTAFLNGGFLTSRMILLNSLIVDITTHENRGKYFGYNFGLVMGSGLVGNLIGGTMGEFLGLGNALVFTAMLHLSSNIFLIFIHESEHRQTLRLKDLFNLKDFDKLQYHIVKIHLIRTFLIGFGAGLFVNFGNIIFKDLFNLQPTMIGAALAFAQFGAAVGSIFSSKISRKIGAYQFSLIMNILVIPLIISFAFVRDPYAFTVLYALRFSFMNMTNPVSTTIVMSYIPQKKVTTISSIRNFLNFISRSLAAVVFGFITSLSNGYTYLFLVSSVFYIISLYFLIELFRPIKKDKIFLNLYK
ncbi:hypothetical protein LN42_06290 [Marinitoga sp. 1137]|uniref:MFS transporter n=2 Tax=Marinitoga TaxID=160798 RepID=UPI0009506FD2|nr:MFS transporter [Marinitoga sp. 1137]APT76033.1 hypothetical protein LN42_06290 [Marinitoga sp. 1137]